jgi:hypothetical protein
METHFAALREWGDLEIDLKDCLSGRMAVLLSSFGPKEHPDYQGLYLAQGLLRGSDTAFRTLFRLHVPGLLQAGRRAGYSRHLVEEE